MLGAILPGAQHLQNIHPLVVHFPLALLPGAALLYVLAWLAGRESMAWTALWFLVLRTASAVSPSSSRGDASRSRSNVPTNKPVSMRSRMRPISRWRLARESALARRDEKHAEGKSLKSHGGGR